MGAFGVADMKPFLEPGYKILGDPTGKEFDHCKPIQEAARTSLVWVNPSKAEKQAWVEQTEAEIILCDESIEVSGEMAEKKCFVVVPNPKFSFLKVVGGLFEKRGEFGTHPTAVIHPEAEVHKNVFIGPFTYVGKCKIGEGSQIHGHVHLYDGVTIGRNVVIHASAVIGGDGFGYARDTDGKLMRFPHIGGVIIEDDVEIGSQTCVDRGSLGDTVICEGAKIDNLVHIAHNVRVGKHTMVIANTMVGGSTSIGDYAWIAPSVSLKNGIKIGDRALAGMGAVVLKDIPEGQVWIGSPAKPLEKKPAPAS